MLFGFLAIAKSTSHFRKELLYLNHIIAAYEHQNDANFRKFRRQLLHSSLAKILESLQPFMNEPEIVRCADGYFRRVIYGLGPYIADYPEQALLACIVQGWCTRLYFISEIPHPHSQGYPRCLAPSKNLDGQRHIRRSRKHTEVVGEEFELGVLWDEYGIVGDIIVKISQ